MCPWRKETFPVSKQLTLSAALSVVAMAAFALLAAREAPPTDAKGIMREGGPLIAWFTDPAGNVFSVIQQS